MDNKQAVDKPFLLLLSVFVVATCGLIYELIAGTVASYLLGDSVTQFSTIIGAYLFSMGIGSYLSKFFKDKLLNWFVKIEIMVGLIGGISSTLLFTLFGLAVSFKVILYALVGITGLLVGLEIPLLMRILEHRYEFKDLVSKVFTFDYIGALLASIIFPLVMIPHLGLMRTSYLFGLINISVALIVAFKFSKELNNHLSLKLYGFLSALLLLLGFIFSNYLMTWTESLVFNENIIYSCSSPYQRIVLTQDKKDLRLYLNENLQFCAVDEYRYHEALVHPLMHQHNYKKILVLGGGDGMAVRELLKYPQITSITLVDLDAKMTDLFAKNSLLQQLNQASLVHPKVKVINTDAFQWLKSQPEQFDGIVVDFPDPSNYAIGKLYSTLFYQVLYDKLADSGMVVIQSTSPLVAPKSFWCINNTLQFAGFKTLPYHTNVPSFGEWGFHLAAKHQPKLLTYAIPVQTRYFTIDEFNKSTYFTPDMKVDTKEINKLNNQMLVHLFEQEWSVYQ